MESPFLRKLRYGADLTADDEAILTRSLGRAQRIEADQDIVKDGERSSTVRLVLEGVACRYKMLPNGKRSILAFLLPGDFCDLHVAILGRMDHAIASLTPCSVVNIPKTTIENWTEHHPRINRALWWATLVDEGVLRAWLANIGARRADERIAHLFCELRLRLELVGLAGPDSFLLPLTQQELADTLGLSVVHVNRTLKGLSRAGAVRFTHGRVLIADIDQLIRLASFDPSYLHLDGSSHQGGTTEGEDAIGDDGRAH